MDEQLALAIGWERATEEPARHNGLWVVGNEYRRLPSFTTSLDDCAEAEAEIARRGLQAEYVKALTVVVAETTGWAAMMDDSGDFALITAPPETRVRAMLEVLKG